MKEKLLVLAKASPIISKKYEALVCVGGITDTGEWRRIYPVPWECFWKGKKTYFKKKSWIEYELKDNEPSDHRQESRKIISKTIRQLNEENYPKIRSIILKHLTDLESLQNINHKVVSMGVIRPIIEEFIEEKVDTTKLKKRKEQKTLDMDDAVKIDVYEKKYSYRFHCSNPSCKGHKILCEDWELGELYRKCEQYRKQGKYKDEQEVFAKVKQKMFDEMLKKREVFFIVGTHYRFDSYIIVGIIYPKKSDKIKDLGKK